MNKISFKSRKEVNSFLKEKGIDTSNWTEEKWQSINISQAEIHIQALAEAMWDAMNESTPKVLQTGEWHIPFSEDVYIKGDTDVREDIESKIKIAIARCARVSYTTVGSTSSNSHTADIDLYNRLLESGHMSPFEHCAQIMEPERYFDIPYSRNFKGFVQYREIVEASLH